jgi:hypothetical protein
VYVCVCVLACMRDYVCGCKCKSAGMCLRACILTYTPYNALPYCHLRPLWFHHIFRHFLIKGTIFGKKLLKVKCVFWFSLELLFEIFLILRRIQPDIVINVESLYVKKPLFLSDFNEKNFLDRFSKKKFRYQVLYKFVQWKPICSMRTDRDMTKLIIFRNFANAPKNGVGRCKIHLAQNMKRRFSKHGNIYSNTSCIAGGLLHSKQWI